MSPAQAASVQAGGSGVTSVQVGDLQSTRVQIISGDSLTVARHGAHVLSWVTGDGTERLYLSPAALLDGESPVRGGVPVCFPQFNNRVLDGVALPKHGLARTADWKVQGVNITREQAELTLGLRATPDTLALWPHDFDARLRLRLTPGALHMAFEVTNTGGETWPFALALHSYLRVDDIAAVRLQGLQGLSYWDAVQDLQHPEKRQLGSSDLLAVSGETDRVYENVTAPLLLRQADGRDLQISQSASLPEAVVWNPGAELCQRLPDLPPDGWQHYLCVEAACINTPVWLAPGQSWSGWQSFSVLPSA